MATKHTAPMLAAALLALACSGDATAPDSLPNRAPAATGEIPAQRLAGPGDSLSVDLAAHFDDPDGDALAFAAASSDTAVVRVAVAGTVASLTGGSAGGGGAVTVTASDPSGLAAAASFSVAVNRAPAASGKIPAQSLATTEGAPVELDMSEHFNDPDGDALAFAAASSDTAVVRVAMAGTVASLTARAAGEAAVTVTARDPDGLEARAVFAVVAEHPDRVALAALYNATDGPNWTHNDGWLTDAPLGEWHGVTVSDGRVVGLSLVRNNVTGAIPPELGYLARLEELDLAINALTGPIPPELGSLARLKKLVLTNDWYSNNVLTGPIPPELGSLARLEVLWLDSNTGPGRDDDASGLSGPIPPELGSLARLKTLGLVRNDLTGPIPLELGNLARLEELNLHHNDLSGPIPPELGGLASLEELNLDRNDLSGAIPPELGSLASLETLSLRDNDLTGPIPPELGNLASLEYLYISGNTGLCALSDPPLLAWLADVGATAFPCDSYDRSALVALYNATDGPNWTGNDGWLTDAPLGAWHGVTVRDGWVVGLSLGDNNLTGPIPPELGGLASLKVLSLDNNNLTGPIPPELGGLASLVTLSLYGNDLSGPIPPELGNLARLEKLLLSGNTGLCAPDDSRLRATLAIGGWTIVFPCLNSAVQLLPSALMRADGNGLSLRLPDDLRAPVVVNVSDPTVVAASISSSSWEQDGLELALVPRSPGTADVEVVPASGGAPAVAGVVVREGVGTFGIDIVVTQPAPVGYAEAMTAAADWWSSVLDGTEWTDRRANGCGAGVALATTVDELLVVADAIAVQESFAARAHLCGLGGWVTLNIGRGSPHSVNTMRHEIGHLLGLVGVGRLGYPLPDRSALTTCEAEYGIGARCSRSHWIGPRAVEAYRAGGGDPDLPGPPMRDVHWDVAYWGSRIGCELMAEVLCVGDTMDGLSLAALADMGYTVDMTKATPWRKPDGAAAAFAGEPFRDVVTVRPGPGLPRR